MACTPFLTRTRGTRYRIVLIHTYYADRSGLFLTTIVDYGYYSSIEGLIKATNTALAKDVNDNIVLTYNSVTRKVTVQLKNGYQLGLVGRLSVVFGFGGKDTKVLKTTESPYVADVAAMSTIYIYCNIVQPQIVGDTNAQLLKSIPVEGTFGTSLLKHSQTFSMYLSKENHSRTWKFL